MKSQPAYAMDVFMGGFSHRGKMEDGAVRVHHDMLLTSIRRSEWASANEMVAGDMDTDLAEKLQHLQGVQYGIVVEGHGGAQYAAFIIEQFPTYFVRTSEMRGTWDLAEIVLSEALNALDEAFARDAREKQDPSKPYATTVLVVKENEICIATTSDRRFVCMSNGQMFIGGIDKNTTPSSPSKFAVAATSLGNTTATTTTATTAKGSCTSYSSSYARVSKHVIDMSKLDPEEPHFILACTSNVWNVLTPREACEMVTKCFKDGKGEDETAANLASAASTADAKVAALVMRMKIRCLSPPSLLRVL